LARPQEKKGKGTEKKKNGKGVGVVYNPWLKGKTLKRKRGETTAPCPLGGKRAEEKRSRACPASPPSPGEGSPGGKGGGGRPAAAGAQNLEKIEAPTGTCEKTEKKRGPKKERKNRRMPG